MSGDYSDSHSNSVVCDASSLISLAETCFLPVIHELSQGMRGHFLISDEVKRECIDRPLGMRSHSLTAVRLDAALRNGWIRLAGSADTEAEAGEFVAVANEIFRVGRKPLRILHRGEAEILALAKSLGVGNVLIDERTTRVLVESPAMLGQHFREEFGSRISVDSGRMREFGRMTAGMNIFRSSELLMVAYEKGFFRGFEDMEAKAAEAGLYSIKFAGCSISFEEIEEFCRGIR
ncbi:MAG: hypothetical protein NT157_02565 [Candidatus Micrarchaeota archaeon]|nr:hypothetical protein [Candidatus Micrarchaeota archaeon]